MSPPSVRFGRVLSRANRQPQYTQLWVYIRADLLDQSNTTTATMVHRHNHLFTPRLNKRNDPFVLLAFPTSACAAPEACSAQSDDLASCISWRYIHAAPGNSLTLLSFTKVIDIHILYACNTGIWSCCLELDTTPLVKSSGMSSWTS